MAERIPEDPASQADTVKSIAEHMSDTGADAVQPRNSTPRLVSQPLYRPVD
jgi:hypothetical protein